MNESRAHDIIRKVIRMANSDIFVSIGGGPWAATRMADNLITQNVRNDGLGISVECSYGKRHGGASTDDLSDDSLRHLVKRAEAIAKVSPADPEHMPLLPASETKKYLHRIAYAPASMDPDPRRIARALAAAARKTKARKFRLSGAFSSGGGFSAAGSSSGLRAWHRDTISEAHMTVLGPSGSGWAQGMATDCNDIDVAAIVEKATDIARRAQNPRDLKSGKYDVIMSPAAVAEIIEFFFYSGCSARSADEGRSFTRGKLGKVICGNNITIRSDPADPACPSGPWEHEGLARRRIKWIDRGRLENLCYSRFWAKKKRKAPTGYPANIIMDGGSSSVAAMIASTERGLLITRFWYIRDVDPMVPSVTGMSRDGLFLIENGRVTKSVRQMRFNENLLDMFNRVEALGVPERAGEGFSTMVPALKVRDFNFTSSTKF